MSKKRVSFSEYDAEHLYCMLRFSWVDEIKTMVSKGIIGRDEVKKLKKFGGCYDCERIGKRLEKCIGEKSVRYVEKLIKEQNKGK